MSIRTTVPKGHRRRQEERAARTRERILTATVDCLVHEGFAATTTTAVQARAGVSRGALMHHFPSKQEILLQAVIHLAAQRGQWLREQAASLPPERDLVATAMQLLWQAMSGPLFTAATELWIAARNDEQLRHAVRDVERRLGSEARHALAPYFGEVDADDPAFRRAFDHTLQTFRGAALTSILRDDAAWESDLVALTTEIYRELRHLDPGAGHPVLRQPVPQGDEQT